MIDKCRKVDQLSNHTVDKQFVADPSVGKKVRARRNLGDELFILLNPHASTSVFSARQQLNGKHPEVKKDDPVIRFIPYIHPTPGKSTIKIKKKGDHEEQIVFVEYDQDSISALKRSEVVLSGISEEVEGRAKLIAGSIANELKLVNELHEEYRDYLERSRAEHETFKTSHLESNKLEARRLWDLAMVKKKALEASLINPHTTRMEIDTFKRIYTKHFNERMDDNSGESFNNLELFTLTAYMCLEKNGGFLSKLPDSFLERNDRELLEKTRILTRHFLVNQKGKNTPDMVEDLLEWNASLMSRGLQTLSDYFSPASLLKIAYPGYLDGPEPIIREWILPGSSKWQDDRTLLKRACKNIFYSQGVVEDGIINRDKVFETDWGSAFRDKKTGLRGVFSSSDFLKGPFDAIRLAAPCLIGTKVEEGQIPVWKFDRLVQWSTEEGLKVLDDLTRYLVEQKLKLFEDDGKTVSPSKIKGVKNWKKLYFEEKYLCLVSAGVDTAEAALKRVYPKLFGWEDGLILPGEVVRGDMWKGKEGKKLFRLRFAHSIYTAFERLRKNGNEEFKNHGVRFNPESVSPITLPKRDFTRLNNLYIENDIYWWKHIMYFNLNGGFGIVANQNQVDAFELLLGKVNKETGCFGKTEISVNEVHEQNPTTTGLIVDLLTESDYEPSPMQIDGFSCKRGEPISNALELLLEPELHGEYSQKSQAFIDAYIALKIESEKEDQNCALEKILGEVSAFDNKELRTVLRTLRDSILDRTNINDESKSTLKKLIQRLIKLHSPNTPYDVLYTAAKANRKYGMENNPLSILNSVLEHIFGVFSISSEAIGFV